MRCTKNVILILSVRCLSIESRTNIPPKNFSPNLTTKYGLTDIQKILKTHNDSLLRSRDHLGDWNSLKIKKIVSYYMKLPERNIWGQGHFYISRQLIMKILLKSPSIAKEAYYYVLRISCLSYRFWNELTVSICTYKGYNSNDCYDDNSDSNSWYGDDYHGNRYHDCNAFFEISLASASDLMFSHLKLFARIPIKLCTMKSITLFIYNC